MLKTEIYIPAHRRDLAFAVVIALFAALIGRFYYLQIYKYEQYSAVSDANRIRVVTNPAPRGNIVDRNGKILAANTSIYAVSVIRDELIDEEVQLAMIAGFIDREEGDLRRNLKKYDQGRFLPVLLARNVSISQLSLIEEHKNELPGILSTKLPVRFYPNVDLASAAHILGYLREASAKELKDTEAGDYSPGDYIGSQGLEKYYESRLRGSKGIEYRQVDALGREMGTLADRKPIPAEPGEEIRLTIDRRLQSRSEALLQGSRGAAVVMNASTGEILAIASKPDFKLTDFAAGMNPEKWRLYSSDVDKPLLNRAVLGLYPPGSSMKLVTIIAAMQRRLVDNQWSIQCTGSYEFGDRTFGCWREEGHGTVNLDRAIVESCNVYFYQLVQRIDINTLANFAKLFGFGSPTGIDLPAENIGLVADRTYMNEKYGRWGWAKGSLLHLSIGQGDILVTPLQMASFIATVATRGEKVRPKLVQDRENLETVQIPLRASTWNAIHRLTFDVVNKRNGTAYDTELARSDVRAYGKTGTAENPHGDPHAWYVGFANRKNETIALSIIIENGGTGGSAAAPIAAELTKLYFGLGSRVLKADP
ncbi:MAG: penicillin-binding protein 2 [Candidatus Marinimicrobia bacterium]|nr:penicillin-binding protein 2 [Candidatus Neomarinimicrobiota bacterium]|tara:strand:+ start:2327 stop:4102 length:1776 start_codon:yes stop_codon:yes gene_type:complete